MTSEIEAAMGIWASRPSSCEVCKVGQGHQWHFSRKLWECPDCMKKGNEKAGVASESGLLKPWKWKAK